MAIGWRGSYIRYRGFFLNIVALYKQKADLRAFLEIILSISTITIFLVFALKPTALTIISLLNEIKEKKATVISLDQKISDLQKAQSVYSGNLNLISNLDAAISAKPVSDLVAKQIVGLAAKDSVKILGFSIGQVTLIGKETVTKKSLVTKPLPEGANEMPISINVQGDYENLIAFVKDIENLRFTTKVDVLGINTSTTNGGTNIVALITGRMPYLGQ